MPWRFVEQVVVVGPWGALLLAEKSLLGQGALLFPCLRSFKGQSSRVRSQQHHPKKTKNTHNDACRLRFTYKCIRSMVFPN